MNAPAWMKVRGRHSRIYLAWRTTLAAMFKKGQAQPCALAWRVAETVIAFQLADRFFSPASVQAMVAFDLRGRAPPGESVGDVSGDTPPVEILEGQLVAGFAGLAANDHAKLAAREACGPRSQKRTRRSRSLCRSRRPKPAPMPWPGRWPEPRWPPEPWWSSWP